MPEICARAKQFKFKFRLLILKNKEELSFKYENCLIRFVFETLVTNIQFKANHERFVFPDK